MTSQPISPKIPNGFRFEFDPANRILLTRYEGRVTEEIAKESEAALRKYWAATSPSVVIVDFSSVTESAVSPEFVRWVADQALVGDAAKCPRVLITPATSMFGMARMFQIVGERRRASSLIVVHTMDEAFATLGVQSPHFEPLD